tara:strand:- start:9447 stop:10457 length:1011 start_codon:yes stop_codon:yes gene_type:complete
VTKNIRFGIGVPTATEGMMYPVPYAGIEQAIRIAVEAESLGYESVWGNDHVSTQSYVRREFEQPPSYFDPLSYLSYLAAVTTEVRLATCVLVLPFRHPVLVAKQAATLDQLSGGRFVLGIGVGAYREEFEAMWPERALHRGDYVDESVEAIQLLLRERESSYSGNTLNFNNIESFPKAIQDPLPILSGGNSLGARQRAGRFCDGWLPACLTPGEYRDGVAEISRAAELNSRTLGDFENAIQVAVSVDSTHEAAVSRFRSSQVHAHLHSLSSSTLKGKLDTGLEDRNLVGTPEEVREKISQYSDAGVDTFAGLLFAVNTVEETLESMAMFAEEVMGL